MRPVQGVNITDREHKANPFAFYAYLRWSSPVHLVALPHGRTGWLVTRYEDVAAALSDVRLVQDQSSALGEHPTRLSWVPAFARQRSSNLTDLDEPGHARWLALLHQALTPKRVASLRDRSVSKCGSLLGPLRGRERMDLIAEYALPIPMMVAADMLGVPEDDRQQFLRWSNAITSAESSSWEALRAIPSVLRFVRYVTNLIHVRRTQGTADLLTALVEAQDAGARLSDNELVATVVLLLRASYETTANLIGNGLLTLLQHPDQLARLRVNHTLTEAAVEELARFTSPVEIVARCAREALAIAGAEIPSGDLVLAAIASANRDHRQFPDPDVLDLSRVPNHHLSFGVRPHDCVVAPLARLVTQIAIRTLLDSAEFAFDRDPARLRWRRGLTVRGLESLPVRILRWRH